MHVRSTGLEPEWKNTLTGTKEHEAFKTEYQDLVEREECFKLLIGALYELNRTLQKAEENLAMTFRLNKLLEKSQFHPAQCISGWFMLDLI